MRQAMSRTPTVGLLRAAEGEVHPSARRYWRQAPLHLYMVCVACDLLLYHCSARTDGLA